MQLRNLKITIRNAWKNRVLSFAKIFGLSLSFAVVLFSVVYVYYETSFDKTIPDYQKIYRCLMTGQFNEEIVDYAVTSPAQAAVMVNDIPEITEAIRIQSKGIVSINYKEQNIDEAPLFLSDPNFFSFFGFNLVTNQENPLASESNVVIARSIAENHFGSVESALGESVKIRNDEYIITGVFDDPPANFHLRVEMLMSIEKSNPEQVGWESQNYYTYFKTSHEDIDLAELDFKISKTVYTHYYDQVDGAAANNWEDLKFGDNIHLFFTAEPLSAIHFSTHKFEPAVTSNLTYVYGAIALSLLVLLISSVNFINLTIANISTRLKEVGIRKTIGANRNDVVIQFLSETTFFVIISFLIAALIYLTIGEELAQNIGFEILISNNLLIKIIAIVFVCMLLFVVTIAVFPVNIASGKKILNLIKEESNSKRRSLGNNTFLLIQFVLSAIIILSSVVVQKQVNYMVSKDRGYDAENVMMLSMWTMNPATRKSFVEKLESYGAVQSVSTGDVYFGQDFGMNGAFFETEEQAHYFHPSVLPVDDKFLETFDLKMSEGRFFEKERLTDFETVILNESAAREYSGEGSILGKDVIFEGNTYQVIGIVKNFNFRSLHHIIEPLLIKRVENFGNVYVKIRNSQIAKVVSIVQDLWKEFNISFPFHYEFHDEVVAKHYIKDQQAKRLLLYLTLISVCIACVGLYAISFFSINKRIKEIGIRKVNGAKVTEILTMLNKDFIKWVAIAFVIATPIAYYAMHKWLENFAYKTELSWWIFALAGILALGIALLTVSWQSWRAATRNPVEALRYE